MQTELQRDLGNEIIMRLKDLIAKLNKLQENKNEEELPDPYISRN
jgi:hypothetical protein